MTERLSNFHNYIKSSSNVLNDYSVIYIPVLFIVILILIYFIYQNKEALSSDFNPYRFKEQMISRREFPNGITGQQYIDGNSQIGYNVNDTELINLGVTGKETFPTDAGYIYDLNAPYRNGNANPISIDALITGGSKIRNKSERSDSSWDWSNQNNSSPKDNLSVSELRLHQTAMGYQ
jgi:hypothetical protein